MRTDPEPPPVEPPPVGGWLGWRPGKGFAGVGISKCGVLGTEGVEEAGGGTRGVESPADSVPVCELFVRVRLRVLSPPDAELPPKPPLGCRRFIGPCDGLSERLIPMDGAERIAAWLRLAPMDPWPMLPPIDPWLALPP